ncbi:hypothetical protein HY338_03825, partial [Candidatus Gottesmanbacteria bacterium]|nr:hypothetical protein [Candidatus Gottesmanbacteria bacterium]
MEELVTEGIASGCGTGLFCPDQVINRDAAAVMLLRAKHGSAYQPPTPTPVFTDVSETNFARSWIEELYKEGITAGCNANPLNYCPESPLLRKSMAVFVVQTFNLYAPPPPFTDNKILTRSYGNNANIFNYYDGSSWNEIPPVSVQVDDGIQMAVFNGMLYISHNYTENNVDKGDLMVYDGLYWRNLQVVNSGKITKMVVYNNKLYI